MSCANSEVACSHKVKAKLAHDQTLYARVFLKAFSDAGTPNTVKCQRDMLANLTGGIWKEASLTLGSPVVDTKTTTCTHSRTPPDSGIEIV